MSKRWVIVRSSWLFQRPEAERAMPTFYLGILDPDTYEVEVMRQLITDKEVTEQRDKLPELNKANTAGPTLAAAQAARTGATAQRKGPQGTFADKTP